MAGQQQQYEQHQQMEAYAEQQERGYLETLQQGSDHLGVQANLLQDLIGSSSAKDQSTNELLHLLAQQGQHASVQSFEPEEPMNTRPEEHYLTIAQDGTFRLCWMRVPAHYAGTILLAQYCLILLSLLIVMCYG